MRSVEITIQMNGPKKIPDYRTVKIGAISIYMIHDLKEMNQAAWKKVPNVVVSGHSHKPSIQERNGILYINPGSAGPRRFKLPISVARLKFDRGKVNATLIAL